MTEQFSFQNPLDQSWNITSQAGGRIDPIYGYNASHRGIDLAVPVGTSVKAAAGGTVLYSKIDGSASGGYGQYVAIKHDNGTVTLYGHLSARDVAAGQRVEAGEQIGLSGNTGKSTGPHLHFQITEGDNPFTGKVINPTKVTSGIGSENISANGNIYVEQQNISNFSANEISGLKGFFKSFYEEASLLVQNLKTSFLDIFNNAFSDNTDNAPKNSDGTVNNSAINNSLLNLTVNTSKDSNNATADPNAFVNGTVKSGGDYSIDMPSDVLNEDGLNKQEASKLTSNQIRPGAQTLTDNNTSNLLDKAANFLQQNLVKPIADLGSSVWNGIQSVFSSLTGLFSQAPKAQNVDPLVLDLDGNGVELISFADSKVSFDVDNDNYKENTGWVKGTDGILVEDKNNNGTIDDITETISEHYTANVADGLEALKTLDSNNDNIFNNQDQKWNDLRVWVDANEDGITDQGELKTFNDLNIQSIDLNRTIAYRERIEGNPVLSRSTYTTTDGQTREAAAVDFTTNPIGYEWNDAYEQGAKISAQDGSSSSFVITDSNGAMINLAEKGVNSGYGNIGNDTIIGDANNNWLMGGKGSDILKSGAGDDVLMIDAEDKNENIDAGTGLDIIKVIDDKNIVFNMTLSNAEVINSGGGDDVLIGGGASNVFISGGAGDDIIIGGAADDALSGEDGEDYIDGGYGDDVVRGHRGNDVLIGGQGNDYIEGGLGDDKVLGGVGNDVLIGNEGNDEIDGGDGFDMVEYAGKYDQYTFSRNTSGAVTVTDTIDGSVDTIKNVERLRFDHVDVNITGASTALPLPVKDNIVVNGGGVFEINQSQLLANDFSTSGKSFSVRNVSDAVGGTVELRADGKIIFTSDPNFIGTMSFDYSVIDSDGNYATISRKKSDGTIEEADLRAQVNLTNALDPSDPLYFDQWYLSEIKVKPVWQDYSGKGVNIGVFEGNYGNPLNYQHADLNDNISSDYLNNILITDDVASYSNHATLVAGVIAAEKNGQGSIGIAYDAKISSLSWDSSVDGLGKLMDYDVANNSWITVQAFADNFTKDYGNDVKITEGARAMQNAAELGRDGLGTNIIFAGGNNRQKGDNVNYHNTQNSRFVITTGSINQEGDLSKLVDASQPFSNPGSAILVSAPGSNIKSTANLLQNSNGSTFGSDFETTQGTSFSAPIVSGVVALMLDANPNLGYRDIQLILARTAKKVEDQNTIWKNNGDDNWNGGSGMHYSEDYGFGIVDAHAAVRMAESWTQINNSLNEKSLVKENNNSINITDNGIVTSAINVSNSSISIEHVEIYVDIDHSRIGDLVLTLISPDGAESILVNRAEKPLDSDASNYGSTQNGLKFNLSSTHYLGESGNGNWILKVEDKASGVSGVLNNWDLKLYGSAKTNDDIYTFTKEFNSNKTISDSSGNDSIDATGILTNSTIDLRSGNTSSINGKNLTISAESIIENAYSGDGNDILIGNESANILYSGRGNNKLTGNAGSDKFVIFKNSNQTDRITDFNASDISEKIDLTRFKFASFADLSITQNGANTEINLGNGQKLILENISSSNISAANFTGFLNEVQNLIGSQGGDNLYGDDRDTIILAGEGEDYINGGKGNNALTGGDGDDIFFIEINSNKTDIIADFNLGNILGHESEEKISLRNFKNIKNINDLNISQQDQDVVIALDNNQKIILKNINKDDLSNNHFIFFGQIVGTDGIDKMLGSDLPDIMSGGNGNDVLRGLEWNDDISGGKGNDEISGDHGDDTLRGELGNDLIFGGIGADTIYGGQDNDILFGGTSYNPAQSDDNKSNTIYGETGSDTIYGDAGADRLYGGYGNDVINGLDGNDEIYGEENNDIIDGGSGNDTIYGGDNDDSIYAGSGNDEIHGGAGDDRIEGIEGNNLIYGDEGNDLIFGGTGIDRIYGGIGNDTVVGENDNSTSIGSGDFLYGEEGDDILLGAASNDEIYGGNGNDVLQGDLGNDKLFGDAGNDVLRGNNGNNEYNGGNGNDVFVIMDNPNGTDIINDFEVNNLNEKINLLNLTNIQDFSQLVMTQVGSDTLIQFDQGLNNQKIILKNINKSQINRSHFITSNNAPEVINQPSEKNSFINTPFSFTIQNSFYDSDGDALTYTAKLSDGSPLPAWINFNPSTLTFSGTAIGSAYNAVITVTATDSKGASTSLSFDFKNYNGVIINGTPSNDFSVGTSGNDYITGAGGNDYLFGGAGNDIVSGDDGNDNIRGDVDASYNTSTGIISISNYDANVGNDTLYGNGGSDTILGDRGNDKIYGGVGDDILFGCEGNDEIYGGDGNDQIVGGIDSNINAADYDGDKIYGEAGNDSIWGANGNDIIYGDSGNDYIYGNKGNDVIYDGGGKDIVYAGEGDDIIYLEGENRLTTFGGSIDTAFLGESGNDIFVISKDNSALAGTGILNDIIYDFEVNNTNEKIDLKAFKNVRDISDLRFSNVNLNNTQFLRIYIAGEENNQFITLKGITSSQLQNSNFIFFNDKAPIAAIDSFTLNEDNSILIKISDLLRNDIDNEDGAPTFYQIASQPLHGSLINNNDGTYTYTPSINFNGSDSFSYKVKDSNGAIRSSVVNLVINSVNDVPTASVTTATVNEDNSLTIDVITSAADIDGDVLTISSVTNGSNGIVSIITDALGKQQINYTPNNNFFGSDSFDYTISDGNGGFVTKTLNVDVNPVNDAPVVTSIIADQKIYITKDFSLDFANTFADLDGDNLVYSATLQDGSALPSWLIFDATNLKITGTAPDSSSTLSVRITAADRYGVSISDDFKISVADFIGDASANTITGANKNDVITGLRGDDILSGGSGNDILIGGSVSALFAFGNLTGGSGSYRDVYVGYDSSSDGNDILNGDEGDDILIGGSVDSKVVGSFPYGDGNDILNGGAGNDVLKGGSGYNILTGGSGSDNFVIENNINTADTIIDFNINDLQEKIDLSAFGDRVSDFAKLKMTQVGNDVKIDILASLILDNGQNYNHKQSITIKNVTIEQLTIDKFIGVITDSRNSTDNLTIVGTNDNDILRSGFGDDILNGLSGDDDISTGAGNDILSGGDGNDILSGGLGSDKFVIQTKSDSSMLDTILDFDVNDQNEKIDLTRINNIEFSDLIIAQQGLDSVIQLPSQQKIIFKNIDKNLLTADKFLFYSNLINGSPINDNLFGSDENDLINASGGNDSVYLSSKGSDTINLDSGNDSFTVSGNGFYGNDNVAGGLGSDKFSIDLGYTSYDTNNYILTIKDFEASNQNEKIYISNGSSINMDFANDLKIDQIGNDVQIKLANASSNKSIILKNVNKADLNANNIVVPQDVYKAIATESDDIITYDSNAGIKNLTGQDYSIIFNGGGISAGGTLTINSPTSTIVVVGGNTTISLRVFDATKDRIKVDPTYGISKYSDMPLVQEGSNVVMNFVSKNTKVVLENVNLADLKEDDFIFYNHSTSGSDIINGLGGNDYIEGGEGNDIISGGEGDDKLLGGNNNDSISGDVGDDEIYGGNNNDSLYDYSGNNKIYGGAGNDKIGISRQNNSISNNELYGEDGDDIIKVSNGGTNIVKGGSGNDEFIVYGGDNQIYGEEGVDNFIISRAYSANFDANGNVTLIDAPSSSVIDDFNPLTETIMLDGFNKESLGDFDIVQDGNDVVFNLSSIQTLRLNNVTKSSLNQDNIIIPDKHIQDRYYYTFDDRTSEYSINDLNKLMSENPDNFYQGPVAEIASNYDPVLMKMVSNFDITKDKIHLGKIKTVEKFEDLKITQHSITQSYGSPSEFTLIDLGNGAFVKLNGFFNFTADNFTFNKAPTANFSSVNIAEDNQIVLDVVSKAIDNDGDVLSITEITTPSHGSATIITNEQGRQKISYIPNPNFNGIDQFNYMISDGRGATVTKELAVTINAVNDAPIISMIAQLQEAKSGELFLYQLPNNLFSDIDGDNLTINATLADGSPLPSWLSFDGNKFSGTPNVSAATNFAIKLTASDPSGFSVSQNFNLNIISQNNIPTASDIVFSGSEDRATVISYASLLANAFDVEDGANIKNFTQGKIVFADPIHGSITKNSTSITYRPNPNFNGVENISYQIKDSKGALSNPVNITINVAPANDAPTADNIAINIDEDNKLIINKNELLRLSNAQDIDGDVLRILSVSNSSGGKAVIDGDNITFTPNKNFNGNAKFSYAISDGINSVGKVANISIAAINDAPTTAANKYFVKEDQVLTISISQLLQNDYDVEDGINIRNISVDNIILENPQHGTIIKSNGNIIYTPNSNFNGTEEIYYQIKDSGGAISNKSAITINITAVNDAPITQNETFRTTAKQPIKIALSDILANAFDVEDGAAIVNAPFGQTSITKPKYGVMVRNVDNSITYTPNNGFIGTDQISYKVKDINGLWSNISTITINVAAIQNVVNDGSYATITEVNEINSPLHATSATEILLGNNLNNNLYYKHSNINPSNSAKIINPYTGDEFSISNKTYSQDAFNGEGGVDTLNLATSSDVITFDNPLSSAPKLASIEIINSKGGNDLINLASNRFSYGDVTINGDRGNEALWGNDGNDIINGFAGNDNIIGGNGNDILSGGDGNDIIKGYNGNDTIKGGFGIDELTGGIGQDIFDFDSLQDSNFDSCDIIRDFEKGKDKIDLSGLGFDEISEFENNNSDRGLEYRFDGSNTIIEDNDSNFAIKLTGNINLDHNDFIF